MSFGIQFYSWATEISLGCILLSAASPTTCQLYIHDWLALETCKIFINVWFISSPDGLPHHFQISALMTRLSKDGWKTSTVFFCLMRISYFFFFFSFLRRKIISQVGCLLYWKFPIAVFMVSYAWSLIFPNHLAYSSVHQRSQKRGL